MELTFSHVDILVSDLDRSIAYDRSIMSCRATVPDLGAAFDELTARGVMPVDESGNPLPFEELTAPQGSRLLWLATAFGDLSIELAAAAECEARLRELSDRAS